MPESLTLDAFSLRSTANLVLPGEQVDEAVRRYVLSVCAKALTATAGYRTWLLEATKRYEALRSTRSLDHDDPGTPWRRASNIGMPLEAFTGEALIPRFNAATVDAEPVVRVSLPAARQMKALLEFEEPLTNWWHDLLMRVMRLRKVRDATHRNLLIDGDGIEEVSFATRAQQTANTVALLQDGLGQFVMTEQGVPRLFQANVPEDLIPEDPLIPGKKLRKVLIQRKGTRTLYEGPEIRSWRLQECIWPEEATTEDINELDFFCVQMWKSPSWFKTREGDPLQGHLKHIDELLLRHKQGIPSHADGEADRLLTMGVQFPRQLNKILAWRFFGAFDVDGDGVDEELVAMVAPRERLLLGWRLGPFAERPFFHFQLFKMPGRFTARGLPHLTRGIRDMIDFQLNQANNRTSIFLNPPLLYEIDSGFDPDIHQYGVGAKWGPLAPGGRSKIGALELPKSQEQVTLEFISFYIGIVQRVTGINDFSLGATQGAISGSVKTASGQAMLQQETNVKFADFIRDFQLTSERECEFIDREFVQSGLLNAANLAQSSVIPLDPQLLPLKKLFKMTGNSTTMNRQVQQEIAILIMDRGAADPLLQVDPTIQRQVRQAVFDAFDVAIQLPPAEQLQQQIQQGQIQAAAEALKQMPEEEKVKLFAGLIRSQTGMDVDAGAGNGGLGQRPSLAA